MATIKTCDVINCDLPARTITVAIDTTNDSENSVGVSYSFDVCDTHRAEQYNLLVEQCLTSIEAIT